MRDRMTSASTPMRVVPPFSLQSLQRDTIVCPLPRSRPSSSSSSSSSSSTPARSAGKSPFKRAYLRGDFPLLLVHTTRGCKLSWKVAVSSLDYHLFLPLFFEGLRETEHPYTYLAVKGVEDLLKEADDRKLLPVLPQLIMPIKLALNTRRSRIMCRTLKCLQLLITSCHLAGRALVPYYRQILPMFNVYKQMNVNTGDGIDYHQRFDENVGDLIEETLQLLERRGGPDAFINIKYMIPTYQSCVNWRRSNATAKKTG